MKISSVLSDEALLVEVGDRLRQQRLQSQFTQAELAHEAGVSKSTVERLESGQSVDFALLLRVLRKLGLIETLDVLFPETQPSPMALLKNKGRQRKRMSHPKAPSDSPREPWSWKP